MGTTSERLFCEEQGREQRDGGAERSPLVVHAADLTAQDFEELNLAPPMELVGVVAPVLEALGVEVLEAPVPLEVELEALPLPLPLPLPLAPAPAPSPSPSPSPSKKKKKKTSVN